MSKRSSGGFGLGTGGASILLIFVLLCLTTFATLSIVSANADYKLTQRNAEAVTEYYNADKKANEQLAQIAAALEMKPEGATLVEQCTAAAAGFDATVRESGDGVTLRYAVPMSDTRELQVAIAVDSLLEWRVMAWQTVSTVEWVEDNGIELWDGGAGELAAELPTELAGLPAGIE